MSTTNHTSTTHRVKEKDYPSSEESDDGEEFIPDPESDEENDPVDPATSNTGFVSRGPQDDIYKSARPPPTQARKNSSLSGTKLPNQDSMTSTPKSAKPQPPTRKPTMSGKYAPHKQT